MFFPKVIGFQTSRDIWTKLEKALASLSDTMDIAGSQRLIVDPRPSHLQEDPNQSQGNQSRSQMDPDLYESAKVGDMDFPRQNKDELLLQLTPKGITLLHVLAQFHDSAECVNAILETQSSTVKQSMILWKNFKSQTALHIAARNGCFNIVRSLIEHAKTLGRENVEAGGTIAEALIRATDQNGDTALHEAVRNKHSDVARLLADEDPDFLHSSNEMGETPLYLAVENDCRDVIDSILTTCKSLAYKGPSGKTALHAAAIYDDGGTFLSKLNVIFSRLIYKNHTLLASCSNGKVGELKLMNGVFGAAAVRKICMSTRSLIGVYLDQCPS